MLGKDPMFVKHKFRSYLSNLVARY
jgi:hypothetical protein